MGRVGSSGGFVLGLVGRANFGDGGGTDGGVAGACWSLGGFVGIAGIVKACLQAGQARRLPARLSLIFNFLPQCGHEAIMIESSQDIGS